MWRIYILLLLTLTKIQPINFDRLINEFKGVRKSIVDLTKEVGELGHEADEIQEEVSYNKKGNKWLSIFE